MDKFGVKYTNPSHYHHLVNTLQKYYKISIDWGGGNYSGLSLDWNYDKNMLMSICLYILQNHFTIFNILHISNLNMPHMTGLPQTMYQ